MYAAYSNGEREYDILVQTGILYHKEWPCKYI